MDRNRAERRQVARDEDRLDEEPWDESDGFGATDSLWADMDVDEAEGTAELDDQDLEIARLLGQDL